VIAVDQDILGLQGERVFGGELAPGGMASDGTGINVWARQLSGGKVALVFLNTLSAAVDITCDESCMATAKLAGKTMNLRDLWKHEDLGRLNATLTVPSLDAEGGCAMYLATLSTQP
jgi:hypothetical protein